jgi:hypothetical protein
VSTQPRTHTSLSSDSAVTDYRNAPLPEFRLLLDQGFPKPPAFSVTALDQTVEVVHFYDFDRSLSQNSTPDWMVYCLAADAGFDGLVARDRSQLDQLAEMFVLSRFRGFSVITWRKAIEDPVREWGQLLAYLPEVKRRLRQGPGQAILLPSSTLKPDNLHNPADKIRMEAKAQRLSVAQIRR